ncbi:cation efflux family-domain-containing protein [Gilbertella persicaria]|uniref:cation efflux family-domain-containing protein n=1 Tax=Gilbertella persicaria TaxID=101096 RepID=UPI00221F3EE3|nr:cation efflux family-domain-containing protein [Gilbertella persicaria]KAI8059072.1 cation efflux family-domain-containing protein [Gilbertella persicaria]
MLTQEKDHTGKLSGGIAIQSSAPIYAQRQHKVPSPSIAVTKEQASLYHTHDDHQHANNLHHSHDHHNHSHDQHEHSHDYSHHHAHAHDHHGNTHDHDEHSHGHDEHSHDHHGHAHDHHAHSHDHHGHSHSFAPVYTKPLPSWIEVFSNLLPMQKTLFTWFLLHTGIGIWLYCMGTSRESLSLVGYAYLMLFDALGVLNSFVSGILRTNSEFGISNTKRPFGAHRYEIVFALSTTIYLMFATMHNTKESLEHFLLQDHHNGELHEIEGHHLKMGFGMFFLIGAAISATCISSVTLRNHDNFVRYLRRRPTQVHGFSYNVVNRGARLSPIHTLLSNVYSSSIVLCGSIILIVYMVGMATPIVDKILALSESVVMFYLGYPTAKALAKVLLQTTPHTVQNGVENRLREILQNPNILHVDRIHFWQTTYGKCVGTIQVQIHPEADEQAVLQFVYQKLQGLTSNHVQTDDEDYYMNTPSSELTVSIVK